MSEGEWTNKYFIEAVSQTQLQRKGNEIRLNKRTDKQFSIYCNFIHDEMVETDAPRTSPNDRNEMIQW